MSRGRTRATRSTRRERAAPAAEDLLPGRHMKFRGVAEAVIIQGFAIGGDILDDLTEVARPASGLI